MAGEKSAQDVVVLEMVAMELEAMAFYRRAAEMASDPDVSFQFDLLAEEEREHARLFFDQLPVTSAANWDELISVAMHSLAASSTHEPRITLEETLKRAIRMERDVEQQLRQRLNEAGSEMVKEIIRQNADSTHGHFQLIRNDLQRCFPETDLEAVLNC